RHDGDRRGRRAERGLVRGPPARRDRPRGREPSPREAQGARKSLGSPGPMAKSERARTTPRPPLRLTDTSFRDGNQSPLGGRLRGSEIFPIARKLDGVGMFAMEAFGGATF